MSVKVEYCTVEERDMDTLFLEAFASDKGFLKLFTDKVDVLKDNDSLNVVNVELSKSDNDGESDITVILEDSNKKIGLLIEDKINAAAMDEQCKRYSIRGKKGIKNGDYSEFHVFIVAPQKYYDSNEEAKKYDHYVSYEECLEYFKSQNTCMSNIWVQQIDQAINKAQKQSNVTPNPARMDFLRDYIDYQRTNYESLIVANDPEVGQAGGWIKLRVKVKNACIYHKVDKGFMDLTFFSGGEHSNVFNKMVEVIHKLGFEKVACIPTGKSMAYRLYVPSMNPENSFEDYKNTVELTACFEAAVQLTKLAELINDFGEIYNR